MAVATRPLVVVPVVLVLPQAVAVTVVWALLQGLPVLQTPAVAVAVAVARGMEALVAPVLSS